MSTVERVYKLAADRGLSVYQLAKKSDVPYTTIKAAEHRGNQLTVDTLYRLSSAADALFAGMSPTTQRTASKSAAVRLKM